MIVSGVRALIARTAASDGDSAVTTISYVEFDPADFDELVSHLEPDDGPNEIGFQYTGRDTEGAALTVRVVMRPSIYKKGESLDSLGGRRASFSIFHK